MAADDDGRAGAVMPKLVLPLPPNELRLNRRIGGYRGKMGLKDRYAEDCQKEALLQAAQWRGIPQQWPVPVKGTVYLPSRRWRADPSDVGGWCKAALDSLVKMGVFPDDNARYIKPFIGDVEYDPSRPRLELEW